MDVGHARIDVPCTRADFDAFVAHAKTHKAKKQQIKKRKTEKQLGSEQDAELAFAPTPDALAISS